MRTTLTIDDDVLAAARHLAARDNKSIGDVISTLARQCLSSAAQSGMRERNGIPLLATQVRPVTSELVNRLQDELQ